MLISPSPAWNPGCHRFTSSWPEILLEFQDFLESFAPDPGKFLLARKNSIREIPGLLRPDSCTKSRTKVLRLLLLTFHSHLEISKLQFPEFSYCTLKKREGLIENHSLFLKSIQKPQVRELSRLCPETSTKLYVQEFGFRLGTGITH
jgi:hypothetical protein